jgi:EpsI family protein
MTPLRWRALWILLAMCVTALLTRWIEPSIRLADQAGKISLETMIPREIGPWRLDERQSAAIVVPQEGGLVSRIYQQVLSRTYIHGPSGRAVMLSIAYGENQSHSHDLHVPDVCYPAGGYQIEHSSRGELLLRQGSIPVKRLVTQLHQRREPLTYWAIVGDRVATSAVGAKLTALAYGLRRIIPDGIIFRVSTVGLPDDMAFATQQEFVQELFDMLSSQDRQRLAALN